MHLSNGSGCVFGVGEAHESETARLTLVVAHNLGRSDLAEGLKHGLKALVVDRVSEVLDVQVVRPGNSQRRGR